jgi:hypothetical protein
MSLIPHPYTRLVLTLLVGGAVVLAQPHQPDSGSLNQQACFDAARATIGQGAVVLRCGDLNGVGVQEAVVASILRLVRKGCTPVSRLLILRLERSGWKTAFDAERSQTKNASGYVGMDYIDDSDTSRGYCVEI